MDHPEAQDNSERHEPLTRLSEVRSDHNVVATYPDVRTARTVIEDLESSGVDGSDISLLGAQLAAPGEEPAEGSEDNPALRTTGYAVLGGAIGAFVGGVAGALIFGNLPIVVAAGLGALSGGSIGGVIGASMRIGIAGAWSDTFLDIRKGNVTVGVHSTDPEEVVRAAEVMERHEPLAMNRFEGAE